MTGTQASARNRFDRSAIFRYDERVASAIADRSIVTRESSDEGYLENCVRLPDPVCIQRDCCWRLFKRTMSGPPCWQLRKQERRESEALTKESRERRVSPTQSACREVIQFRRLEVTVRRYCIHTDFGDMEFSSDNPDDANLVYWWERIISGTADAYLAYWWERIISGTVNEGF